MIIVYSKNDCPACRAVMTLLANNEVEFDERNINDDDAHMEAVKEMGYNSVPVTITKEGKEIAGFDLPELQKLIKGN